MQLTAITKDINSMLSKINFIGICLILLTVIFGNKIATGRYCAYYDKDTIWAFGQIENSKRIGFWVFLGRGKYNGTLDAVGNFNDDKLNGWWVEYYEDSLQTKYVERRFVNDTIVGFGNFYDEKGLLKRVQWYENGEIIGANEIWKDGKFYPSNTAESTFLKELITPDNEDLIVIINSWSNIIDKTVAGIAVFLLIVNVLFFFLKTHV